MTTTGNEMGRHIGDGYTPLDQLVSPVGPQSTIPYTSADSEVGLQEPAHLFGESQFHDNLGPVYAVPPYPVQHEGGIGTGQSWENLTHPALFGQGQFHNNLGPVYAVPTYPWPHGNTHHEGNHQPIHGGYQNMGSGQWQQWGIHPHAPVFPVYYWGWYPTGHN